MSNKIPKELTEAYQKVLAISFNQAPIDQIDTLIVPDITGFGTTVDEQLHNLKDFISVVNSQEKQTEAEGMEFHFETKTLHRRISPSEDSAIFVDLVKATLSSNDEAVHEFTLRLSLILEYIEGQWKLVHLHGSMPVDTDNDPWHIDEYKRENEKLEKLVAEQTADLQKKNLELEIEAASERVRAHAMGMQKPDDIMNVLNVMKEEVDKFDLGNIATWIWTKDDDGLITQWDISEVIEEGNLVNFNLRFDIDKWPEVNRHTKEWEKGKSITR